MNGLRRLLKLALALAILAPCLAARAESAETGRVVAGKGEALVAPMDGVVRLDLQQGQWLAEGETVGEIGYTAVYASTSGRVAEIFLEEGDEAGGAPYGVLAIEPESLFTIYATAENAYVSLRTMVLHVGQIVYLRCAANGTHRGYGRITALDGLEFTVEALGGEFYNGEAVDIYLEKDMESVDRIGKGTCVKPLAETVASEGVIAEMFVNKGETVEVGQILFTLAVGAEPGAAEGELKSPVAGYVAEALVSSGEAVEAGEILARICPAEELAVEFAFSEESLFGLYEGQEVTLSFSEGEEPFLLSGEISMISYLPVSSENDAEADTAGSEEEQAKYTVLVSFDSQGIAVPGMLASLLLSRE